jgi:amino acid transporter
MVLLVGTPAGQSLINGAFQAAGLKALSWAGHGGFDTLLSSTAPMFWLFFLATDLSLFVLRVKDRAVKRPYSVPLYPILPLIFCGMCGFMIYSATVYAKWLTLLGVAPVVLGVFVLAFCRQGDKPAANSGPSR